MLSENYLVIVVLFGLASGVFIALLISYNRQSNSIPLSDKLNIEERISPFIEVHESLLIDPEQQNNSVATEALKLKIEGLKNSKRVYQL